MSAKKTKDAERKAAPQDAAAGDLEAYVTSGPDGIWIRLGPFESRPAAERMVEKVLKAVAS